MLCFDLVYQRLQPIGRGGNHNALAVDGDAPRTELLNIVMIKLFEKLRYGAHAGGERFHRKPGGLLKCLGIAPVFEALGFVCVTLQGISRVNIKVYAVLIQHGNERAGGSIGCVLVGYIVQQFALRNIVGGVDDACHGIFFCLLKQM
ncbi:MAG: hypothetical protein JJE25_14255 [Bacteroidia bacterium]|nr:hypothetical protein [Bacteroidia bacterium]